MSYFRVEICTILLLVSMVHGGYFSHHQGSILNRNGKRSYLLDLVRNEAFEQRSNNPHDYDVYDQADKLSLRKNFSHKFPTRDIDKDYVREALLEYLASRYAERYEIVNDFKDSPMTDN